MGGKDKSPQRWRGEKQPKPQVAMFLGARTRRVGMFAVAGSLVASRYALASHRHGEGRIGEHTTEWRLLEAAGIVDVDAAMRSSFGVDYRGEYVPRSLIEVVNCNQITISGYPGMLLDGTYVGEDPELSLRGPDEFQSDCLEGGEENCALEFDTYKRRALFTQAPRCEPNMRLSECSVEWAWVIYGVFDVGEGEESVALIKGWADGATVSPTEITQWETLEFGSIDIPAGTVCQNPDCFVPITGISVECAVPNRTLPPSWTPYPTPAPAVEVGIDLNVYPSTAPFAFGEQQGGETSGASSLAWGE
ncbi:unnamed protein product, partial [Discosporangium mesarthrocarpum]